VVATVPIALVGWFFGDFVERLRQPAVVAVALAVGALGILVAERVGSHRRTAESLSLLEAVGLGCAQAAALVPGVSRSGAVLTVAMLFGLTRESAARFTFLVGIPAIFAAAIRAAWTQGVDGMAEHTIVLLVGFATSGLVGYLAVTGLLRYIASHSLDLFAYYRLVIAAVLGIWLVAL
jgi:undecaprenyl-diphosphatase